MHVPSHMPCDTHALRASYEITMQYARALHVLCMCPRSCHARYPRYARAMRITCVTHAPCACDACALAHAMRYTRATHVLRKPAAGNGHLGPRAARAGAGDEGLTRAAARRRRAIRGLREDASDTRRHRSEAAPSSQSEPGSGSFGGPADAGGCPLLQLRGGRGAVCTGGRRPSGDSRWHSLRPGGAPRRLEPWLESCRLERAIPIPAHAH